MITAACLTTIESRKEQLKKTIASLSPQVDKLYIAFQYHYDGDLPDNTHMIEIGNTGDIGKFWFYCHFQKNADRWFFCDDDLIYHKNYIRESHKHLDSYPDSILSYHGRTIRPRPIESYYRFSRIKGFRCREEVIGYHDVGVNGTLGTGVMFFNQGAVSIKWEDFRNGNMADIWLAKFAIEQGKRMIICPHVHGWVEQQSDPDSIFERHQFSDEVHTEIYNGIKFY